jgi:hypothetical protein
LAHRRTSTQSLCWCVVWQGEGTRWQQPLQWLRHVGGCSKKATDQLHHWGWH